MIEIAIDGTAASGKGTLAKNLSRAYGYPHLDTGLMYRKVAYNILIKCYKLLLYTSILCQDADNHKL
jgi:cytidylate kinase